MSLIPEPTHSQIQKIFAAKDLSHKVAIFTHLGTSFLWGRPDRLSKRPLRTAVFSRH